ncbi:MAG: porin family protein [Tatlockia sp.]|nr:porin family protein [Tatlockia sp.]
MKKSMLSFILTAFFATTTLAGTMGPVRESSEWSGVATISGGSSWVKAGETQTFYLAPQIVKTYVAQKSSHVLATGNLFLGIQKNLDQQWIGQLGLEGAITSQANLQGIIWDDADPRFDNYRYQYKLQQSRIALKGKLLHKTNYWLTPWVSGSLGVGFNRAYNYTNTPLIPEAIPNTNFRNHCNTSLAYTISAGVQKAINQHLHGGVGYEFADWGKSNLGSATGQSLNSGLHLNHFITNSILLYLSFSA